MAEYLERQKVIDCFEKCLAEYPNNSVTMIKRCFENLPAENVDLVVYGEWIDVGDFVELADGTELPVKVCSACGEYIVLEDFQNFCPNCGAKNEIEKIKYFERTN